MHQYINDRYDYLVEHKFGVRLEKLKVHWNDQEAEAMDRDHQRACKHAAQKCWKKPNIAYVRQIADLRAQKNVLCKILSGSRLRRNFDRQIALTMMETTNFLIPLTLPECKLKLREVQTTIRKLEQHADQKRAEELESIMEDPSQSKKVTKEIK